MAVPKPLFQGSLLLGTMTKLLLPSELLNGREVRRPCCCQRLLLAGSTRPPACPPLPCDAGRPARLPRGRQQQVQELVQLPVLPAAKGPAALACAAGS